MDNLDNVTDLYNIIATLCQYIVGSNNKNYLVRYGCISTSEKKRVKEEIELATPLKRGDNGRFIRAKACEITNVFVSQIDVFAQNLMLIEDYNCIMGLLQALDGTLSELLKLEVMHFGELDDTPVLNTNRAATGIGLFPRCECVWARKSRMSYSYRRLDNYLKHFIVMEDRVLYEIQDRHIFLPEHFFRGFDRNNSLKVAASPITAKASFEISRYENNNFKVFSIKYDQDRFAEDNLLIWNKITEAGRHGSEIIVFPEMLGNRETEDFVINRL